MCGITGVYCKNESGNKYLARLNASVHTLGHRGPDYSNEILFDKVGLGHARLSIIDTTEGANQPFSDASGRYHLVFNGEIYNYQALRKELEAGGFSFKTSSDTEVLLAMFIAKGSACLSQLNGFFSFAIFDKDKGELFLARDRYGIKPLLIYQDEEAILFGSEMKALLAYGIKAELNPASLSLYFQLNYIPDDQSIFQGITKLKPGHFAKITSDGMHVDSYYQTPLPDKARNSGNLTYEKAQEVLVDVMRSSVNDRLVSDVPLGTFLSGGIDSSVITALAAEKTPGLKTFSVGYADEPFFDETQYAELVAEKYNTDHTTFKLTNDDLLNGLTDTLDAIDEPFADSSALAVNILSKRTREHVTVALSGDGADELFSGYNKHMAIYRMQHAGLKERGVKMLSPLWDALPKSRSSSFGNKVRQFERFATAAKLSPKDQYWHLASISKEEEVSTLFSSTFLKRVVDSEISQRKQGLLAAVSKENGINGVLHADVNMVLPGDMLTKVDLMSMSHSLEVRVPFLDQRVVDFAMTLPEEYKIDANQKKRIVQDAFRSFLPEELYNRPKHGFEVPLLRWMTGELKDWIVNEVLPIDKIEEQGLFSSKRVIGLLKQLQSTNPGDAHAKVWALVVFQQWYDKTQNSITKTWS